MICILFFATLLPLLCRAQKWGVGGSVLYNFQTEGIGAGARASYMPNNTISLVPQVSYYFGFNKVSEYNIGIGAEYKFIKSHTLNFYALGHGAYNRWINYESSPLIGAQKNNWNLEGGIGVSTTHCLRPFIEYRYNIKFRESHLQAGLLYIIGCNGVHKRVRCPAYY